MLVVAPFLPPRDVSFKVQVNPGGPCRLQSLRGGRGRRGRLQRPLREAAQTPELCGHDGQLIGNPPKGLMDVSEPLPDGCSGFKGVAGQVLLRRLAPAVRGAACARGACLAPVLRRIQRILVQYHSKPPAG